MGRAAGRRWRAAAVESEGGEIGSVGETESSFAALKIDCNAKNSLSPRSTIFGTQRNEAPILLPGQDGEQKDWGGIKIKWRIVDGTLSDDQVNVLDGVMDKWGQLAWITLGKHLSDSVSNWGKLVKACRNDLFVCGEAIGTEALMLWMNGRMSEWVVFWLSYVFCVILIEYHEWSERVLGIVGELCGAVVVPRLAKEKRCGDLAVIEWGEEKWRFVLTSLTWCINFVSLEVGDKEGRMLVLSLDRGFGSESVPSWWELAEFCGGVWEWLNWGLSAAQVLVSKGLKKGKVDERLMLESFRDQWRTIRHGLSVRMREDLGYQVWVDFCRAREEELAVVDLLRRVREGKVENYLDELKSWENADIGRNVCEEGYDVMMLSRWAIFWVRGIKAGLDVFYGEQNWLRKNVKKVLV